MTLLMPAPPIPQRWMGRGGASDLRACLWVACYARCQPGSFGFLSFVARVRAGAEVITFPSACIYGTTIFMKKSIKVAPKKRRGRPPSGGRDPHVTLRMPRALIEQADAWAEANDTVRSEAIRRLVELGLTVKTKSAPSERQRAALADLASKAIDSLTVGTADSDEKASRKRRLIKGPEEFREVRVDRPGKKRS